MSEKYALLSIVYDAIRAIFLISILLKFAEQKTSMTLWKKMVSGKKVGRWLHSWWILINRSD